MMTRSISLHHASQMELHDFNVDCLLQVLIEIKAGGLNPIDVYIAERYMNRRNPASTFICGHDGAGFIQQIGKGITKFKVVSNCPGLWIRVSQSTRDFQGIYYKKK